jgi:hypothetical protein
MAFSTAEGTFDWRAPHAPYIPHVAAADGQRFGDEEGRQN